MCTCVCGYVHLSAGHRIPLEMELQAVLSCPIWVQTSNSGPLQGQYASLTTELNCLQLQDSICFIYALCCPLRFQLMYWWSHLVIFLSFFIDFKLPIFRETLWFIIKLFVVSVVCGAHCLLALFLLCPLWYSGMSRLILVLIFFSRFSSTPVSVQKCTAVSCVCLSALHLYYLRQVCLQSWLCQWIPSSAPEARGQSLCTTVPRSPLGAGLWSQGLVIV